MSTFGGISLAVSGMNAAQQALDVAGDNLANQSTAGYTRRRLETASTGGSTVPAIWSRSTSASGGVTITGITRVSDSLISQQLASASGEASLRSGQQTTASNVESLFDEPGDNGLQAGLSTLWSSFSDLAADPTNGSLRSTVLSRATQVTDTLHSVAAGLTGLSASTRTSLASTVATANTAIAQVADLNGKISAALGSGADANDLEDQRDQLVQSLASSLGATYSDTANGGVNVVVGGTTVVSGNAGQALKVTGDGATTQVTVASTGSPAGVTSGDAGAALDALAHTIPSRQAALDTVAASIASQVNTLQARGYDQNGSAGTAFFTGTTAATLTVALTSGDQIAASSVAPTGGTASRDGSNADDLGELGATGSADSTYQNLVADIGNAVNAAATSATAATSVQTGLQSSRDSVSGVSVDEETASLVQYQRAYEGSAKYLSVLSDVFQTLINTVSS